MSGDPNGGVTGEPAGRPRLLEQQRAALALRGTSVGLSAGAGCGKTFVLTHRFLQELEPSAVPSDAAADPLDGIVAFTFTNKAAREMRDRIRVAVGERLASAAAGERGHWAALHRRVDAARISTIHSFCTSFLRAHAAEAGLDPRFAVLDPTRSDTLRTDAVADALRAALAAREERALELVTRYGLSAVVGHVSDLLGNTPRGTPFDPVDFDDLTDLRLRLWRDEHLPPLRNAVHSAASPEFDTLLSDPPNTPGQKATRGELRAVLAELPTTADFPALLERARPLLNMNKLGRRAAWSDPAVGGRVSELVAALRDAIDVYLKAAPVDGELVRESARLGAMFLPLAADAAARYDRAKAAAGGLDNDDLIVRTRDLLRDPAVAARAAARVRFLMVDEFQDTDPVQAEIVTALCTGGTERDDAAGGRADAGGGKLFLVGDVKQSIYGFRGADPGVFLDLRDRLPEAGRLPLTVNFRSRPEVLRFVNALFGPALGDGYEPLAPPPYGTPPFEAPPATGRPCVEFLFPAAGDGGNADAARLREAAALAGRIRELLDSPDPILRDPDAADGGGLRRVRPGDVAVLFRAATKFSVYERALQDAGIESYVVKGLAFYAQQEVHDLAHLLLWLDEPDDTLSLAGVLRSPMFGLSDDALFGLADTHDSLTDGVLSDRRVPLPEPQAERLAHARRVLGELRGVRDTAGLAGLLSLAVDRTGYDASLLGEFLGERKLANLRKLLDMAREADRDGTVGLRGFADRLRTAIGEAIKEETAALHPEVGDVVRLMTVHQAKGLEFPVTCVADLTAGGTPRGYPAELHPRFGPVLPPPTQSRPVDDPVADLWKSERRAAERAESLRIFYVAATRAEDLLILSGATGTRGFEKAPWYAAVAAVYDPATGLPRAGAVRDDPPSDPPPVAVPEPAAPPTASPAARRGVSPAKFGEVVAAAEPGPLPRLYEPVPVPPRPTVPLSDVAADLEGDGGFLVPADDPAGGESHGLRHRTAAGGHAVTVTAWVERLAVDGDAASFHISTEGSPDAAAVRLWLATAGVAAATDRDAVGVVRLGDVTLRLTDDADSLDRLGTLAAAVLARAAGEGDAA